MDLFVKLTITGLIFYTIFFYIRTKIFLNKAINEKNNIKQIEQKSREIIIAIPVLREQNCIENTIKYFNTITKDIPIILITTQKEIKENLTNEKTTQDIIEEKIVTKDGKVYKKDDMPIEIILSTAIEKVSFPQNIVKLEVYETSEETEEYLFSIYIGEVFIRKLSNH